MTRICVFGTSHLAALRLAYLADPARWAGIAFTFVGATGRKLLEHTITDGVMTPATDRLRDSFRNFGGVSRIDLADADAHVVVGGQIGLHMIGFLYQQARWCDLPSFDAERLAAAPKMRLVSQSMLTGYLHHRLAGTVGGALALQLRAACTRPVTVISSPRVDAVAMKRGKRKLAVFRRAVRSGDAAALSQTFDRIVSGFFDNAGVTYLPQPAQTISRDVFTKSHLMRDARRLTPDGATPQPKSDLTHANAIYGAFVLDQIAAALTHVKQ